MVTQGDLFKPPFYISVVYHDGRKSLVREFAAYSQMVLEANDLLQNDSDICKIALCERTDEQPKLIRWIP